MGYYVQLTDSDVILKQQVQEEILQRWKELNKPENNHLKYGGSWVGGKQVTWHYSWMDKDYDKKVDSPQEVLEMMGFEYDINEDGDIYITNYHSKTGSEDLFLKTIADLIEPGSTMLWHGEDGANFAWYFNGKDMQEMDLKQALKLAVAEQSKALNGVQSEPFIQEKIECDKDMLNRRFKSML